MKVLVGLHDRKKPLMGGGVQQFFPKSVRVTTVRNRRQKEIKIRRFFGQVTAVFDGG